MSSFPDSEWLEKTVQSFVCLQDEKKIVAELLKEHPLFALKLYHELSKEYT